MKRLLLITLLIGYIYPCVAQDKPIRTEESLEGTVIYQGNRIKIPTTFSDIQYLMPLCTIFSSY